jgi:hypothetical protein
LIKRRRRAAKEEKHCQEHKLKRSRRAPDPKIQYQLHLSHNFSNKVNLQKNHSSSICSYQ